jgi:MoaA/NifB/PqqE/SkfB family radical SAM enzyme
MPWHPATVLGVRDVVAYARAFARNAARVRRWGRLYEASLRTRTFRMPMPTVLQLLPTEACNLRCSYCNQWGDSGYLKLGVRKTTHMPPDGLRRVLREIDPRHTAVSIHGGEPFAYKHLDVLLDALAERPYDTMFSTNGTLLDRDIGRLARIERLGLLCSIDGDEAAHDAVRGAGTYRAARDGLRALAAERRRLGKPAPFVVLSHTVCEATTGLDRIVDAGRELGACFVNLNMRWFLREADGAAYERHLQRALGVKSSGAWRGWLVDDKPHDYRSQAAALARMVALRRFRPPYLFTTPWGLRGGDFLRYFTEPDNVFGNETCFMPSYWARIHANGDLIYCPGHPDVIAGNVFRDGLAAAFNSETSIRFRQHLLEQRMPICQRCCGLYMNHAARKAEQRARGRVGLPRTVEVGS